jgi:uncharacterized protein (DUF362 family)
METMEKSEMIVEGVAKGAGDKELASAIRNVFLKATDNLSWLSKGETVLLKPALNSADPYPATTHPMSVRVVAECLEERGAKVVVGDQSGIDHLLQGPSGVIKGASKANFIDSGMAGDGSRQFVGFEEEGWENGYHKFSSDKARSWPVGFNVTNWIQKADHIVSLPRVSTHAQAGVSLGFKNMVGLLREDSRMDFHANGPLNAFIKWYARGSGLDSVDDHTNAFFEKVVEISLAIQEKLRLTLFTATKVQTTFGPDKRVAGVMRTNVMAPETGLVFASKDQVASEVFALAFLTHMYSKTKLADRILQKIMMLVNSQAQELGTEGLYENRFVFHAIRLGMGNPDFNVHYDKVPDPLRDEMDRLIAKGRLVR